MLQRLNLFFRIIVQHQLPFNNIKSEQGGFFFLLLEVFKFDLKKKKSDVVSNTVKLIRYLQTLGPCYFNFTTRKSCTGGEVAGSRSCKVAFDYCNGL